MRLNADIVFDNLPPQLEAHMDGIKEDRLLLARPQLYEGMERPFEAGTLTIVRAERLPQRARAEVGAVIICIGSSPHLRRYKESCCVIQVSESCDFYRLFNSVQRIFDRYDAWEHELLDIADESADISRMLTASEQLLDQDLLAIDKDFRVIGTSAHSSFSISYGQAGLPGAQNLDLESFDAFIGSQDLSMQRQEPFMIELLGTSTLNYNLYADEEYAGCVTLQYVTRKPRTSDAPILKKLGMMVLRAQRQLSTLEVGDKGTMRRALQDLVEGYPLDSVGRDLFERAAARRTFACLRLKLSSRLANLPIGYIRNMVESSFPRSVVFEHHHNSVVAFIDLDELNGDVPYLDAIRTRLEPFTGSMGMSAGLSDPVRDPLQARLYYLEANIALENGQLFAPDEALHTFRDHVLEDMVIGSLGELPLEMLCSPGLMRLIEHDATSTTSYVDTLRRYLENNGNVTKTAADLYVHRSTLLERLARIRRELGLDLDDPDTQLQLRMLLKALALRG